MGKTLWLGKLAISAGVTGRGNNDSNPPWMGFYYGSWFPRTHWNGGRFGRREVVDVGWHWLCFHGSWTWWPGGGTWFWRTIQPKTPNVEVQRDSGGIIAGGSAGTTGSAAGNSWKG